MVSPEFAEFVVYSCEIAKASGMVKLYLKSGLLFKSFKRRRT